MARIAYLSMDSLDAFECYDHLTIPHLEARGHVVEEVSWRQAAAWDRYDYVIVRSPWDYQEDPDGFMAVLETIDRSRAVLVNPLPVIRWNIDKRYLRELEDEGARIVPTQWTSGLDAAAVEAAFAHFGVDELIVKPTVSANADDTFRIPRPVATAFVEEHAPRFAGRPSMLQPFLAAILGEGEFSLFYFAGEFSHCILKTPKAQDFRVQEEHGGRLRLVKGPEEALLAAGRGVLESIGDTLLYARLDFVRDDGEFLLMEAELIEPSLYFNMDPDSPERFAGALHRWIETRGAA
jgi:hypothetical protein